MKRTQVIIWVKALHKALGGKRVLNGVDLDVRRGEILVIIGRSGCGKSVLLKHLIGLMRPDEGQVVVEGVAIEDLAERRLEPLRLQFGMLFQGAALFDSLTVFENVAFPLREHTRMPPDALQKRVALCLTRVGLEGVEQHYPEMLSGGMQKRVGLARAIALGPKIVLYDEPTSGLDRLTGQGINALILELNSVLGVTSVVVTHDIESALSIATRIALLTDGRVAALGTPEELQASKDEMVQAFLTKRFRTLGRR